MFGTSSFRFCRGHFASILISSCPNFTNFFKKRSAYYSYSPLRHFRFSLAGSLHVLPPSSPPLLRPCTARSKSPHCSEGPFFGLCLLFLCATRLAYEEAYMPKVLLSRFHIPVKHASWSPISRSRYLRSCSSSVHFVLRDVISYPTIEQVVTIRLLLVKD